MSQVQFGVSKRKARITGPFCIAGTRLESTTDIVFRLVTDYKAQHACTWANPGTECGGMTQVVVPRFVLGTDGIAEFAGV